MASAPSDFDPRTSKTMAQPLKLEPPPPPPPPAAGRHRLHRLYRLHRLHRLHRLLTRLHRLLHRLHRLHRLLHRPPAVSMGSSSSCAPQPHLVPRAPRLRLPVLSRLALPGPAAAGAGAAEGGGCVDSDWKCSIWSGGGECDADPVRRNTCRQLSRRLPLRACCVCVAALPPPCRRLVVNSLAACACMLPPSTSHRLPLPRPPTALTRARAPSQQEFMHKKCPAACGLCQADNTAGATAGETDRPPPCRRPAERSPSLRVLIHSACIPIHSASIWIPIQCSAMIPRPKAEPCAAVSTFLGHLSRTTNNVLAVPRRRFERSK